MDMLSTQIQHINLILLFINALVHICFAGAVAKDAAELHKVAQRSALVSPHIWAFAVLIGGVMAAGIYWFIHHSTFTIRQSSTSRD